MATIKSFTSLEQSRKLAEILPLESADMHYCLEKRDVATGYEIGITPFIKAKRLEGKCNIVNVQPAWSLAVLLELLPKRLEIEDNVCELSVYLYGLYYWNINNGNPCFESKYKDNLVDACYEMIIRLHELNLL